MTTIEKLQALNNKAQLRVKIARHSANLIEAMNRPEDFTFITFGMEITLFDKTAISCGDFTFRLNKFNHFLSMGEDVLTDEQVKKVNNLKRSARCILNNEDEAWRIFLDVNADMEHAKLTA